MRMVSIASQDAGTRIHGVNVEEKLVERRYAGKAARSRGLEGWPGLILLLGLTLLPSGIMRAEEAWRQWRDSSGNFQVRAKLVEQTETDVRLQREDGRLVQVPIVRLGAADQDYLARRTVRPKPKPDTRTDEQRIADLPPELMANLRRAVAALEARKPKEALVDLQVVQRAMPESRLLRLLMATCQTMDRQHAAANLTLTRLLEEFPQDVAIRELRAQNFNEQGQHAQAVLDYAQVLMHDPDNQGALNDLAWLLATSPQSPIRNGTKAVELATKACARSDYKVPHQLSTLAAAYAEKGDFEQALEWSSRAFQLAKKQRLPSLGMYEAELDCYLLDRPWRTGDANAAGSGGTVQSRSGQNGSSSEANADAVVSTRDGTPRELAQTEHASDQHLTTPLDDVTIQQLDQAQVGVDSDQAERQVEGFKIFRRLAGQGVGPAWGALGSCYFNGTGTPRNDDEAFQAFSQGAQLQDPRSLNGLGLCHFYGRGTVRDKARGLQYWEQAFAKKSTLAAIHLALVYLAGDGVSRDPVHAARCVRVAAYKGHTFGMALWGSCLCAGEGITKDPVKGLEWLRKSAQGGDPSGMQLLGQQLLAGQPSASQAEEGILWLTKSANKGLTGSMILLGRYYRHGVGVEQDTKQAIAWWERAVEAGDQTALGYLGEVYINGDPPIRNDAKGVAYLQRAVKSGDARAHYWLGFCYLDGRGVVADEAKAEGYFRESLRLGHASAQAMLTHIAQSRQQREAAARTPSPLAASRPRYAAPSRSGWSQQQQQQQLVAGLLAVGMGVAFLDAMFGGGDSSNFFGSSGNNIADRQAELNRHQADYWRQRAERERAGGYSDAARQSDAMSRHYGGF